VACICGEVLARISEWRETADHLLVVGAIRWLRISPQTARGLWWLRS